MVDVLIENGVVITMDRERRVLGEKESDGAVAIEGNRIIDVGTTRELREKYKAKYVIDARNRVVMPGMIDCHSHALNVFNIGEHLHPTRIINIHLFMTRMVTGGEDYHIQGLMTALERIKFGVTNGINMVERIEDPIFASEFARGLDEVGARGIVSMAYLPQDPFEDFISTAEKVIQRWHGKGEGRIQVWLGPWWLGGSIQAGTQPPTYEILEPSKEEVEESIRQGREIRAIMSKYNVGMHTHAMRSYIKFAHEKTGPDLWLGSDVLAAHCLHISDEEIQILAQTRTNVAHCPIVYGNAGSQPMRLPEMLDAGVNVGLGVDHGIKVSYDLLREMKVAMILQRVRMGARWVIPPGKALEMVTIDAARALGQEALIGSIEPGKRADIILIDIFKPHLTPMLNLPSRIVYEADGHDVDTVLVDGEIVMEKRKMKKVDERKILEEAHERGLAMVERAEIQPFMERHSHYWGHTWY